MAVMNRILRLRPGESGIVLTMGLVLIINFLAQQLSEITAISNFLANVGTDWMLVVWMIDSVLILVSMGLQSLIIDRFNRVKLMRWLILIFGLFFVALRGMDALGAPDWLLYGLWYLLATQQLVFFPVIFWILANDMFDVAQATRLFPLITSLGFVGRLLGIGVSLAVPLLNSNPLFQTPGLLLISAGMYFLTLLIFWVATRNVRLRQMTVAVETVKETLTEGMDFVRDVPAFRYLAVSAIALLVCDSVIEFRFLVVSGNTYTSPESYSIFYAYYRLAVTVLAMLIQGLLTSRVIATLTLKRTFFIKPIATVLSALLMFFQVGIVGAVGGVMLMRLSQYSIDEPTRKAFQSLVPEERRGRVSIFLESYLYFLGTVVACTIIGIIVLIGIWSGAPERAAPWYVGLGIISAVVSVVATSFMYRVYDASLLNWRLKRRQRGRSVLDGIDF